MKLSDEQLEALTRESPYNMRHTVIRDIARELLAARKVVEAARKLPTEADPVRYAGGCRTGASTVWDESLQELAKALTALDEATK